MNNKKYLILSDIHGNVSAFNSVLEDCKNDEFEGIIILGDCIDYGMRSNDIIESIIKLGAGEWKDKILVNIWGNHEKLVVDKDLERLSSDRGRVMAKYTAGNLTDASVEYINTKMNKAGFEEVTIEGFKFLAVHGSMQDNYWKSIMPGELRGDYKEYDFVLSGHSHYPHCFAEFYDVDDPENRNKKAVTFINPGSVGQPRNHNPMAQYAVLSLPSKRVELRAVEYDIEYEQSLFPDEIDAFYKTRLTRGV
ncbi:metallophosphoesterase family protein [Eubacterium ruminantium]|uniref:metallophosphoesterase family protein n=1 Tax=Eubacterium ruminantium TaxID=42322 RepID=UPI00156979C8|nr:metallophosphoesterase family protein [Eubacterium ruminantium]